jgi:hypothetical protein
VATQHIPNLCEGFQAAPIGGLFTALEFADVRSWHLADLRRFETEVRYRAQSGPTPCQPVKRTHASMGCFAARRKKPLAIDAIGRDGIKSGLRSQPLAPYLRLFEFDVRPLRRIDQNAAVGVEQRHVAFREDFESPATGVILKDRTVILRYNRDWYSVRSDKL